LFYPNARTKSSRHGDDQVPRRHACGGYLTSYRGPITNPLLRTLLTEAMSALGHKQTCAVQ